MDWEVVIGLEVHAQLNTATKIFCGCPTAFGAEPNSHTCPVCLAMPGALPVLNGAAVDKAIALSLAIGAELNRHSVFARKNYFYPDLPKGYQISQYELPVVGKGQLTVQMADGSEKVIGVTRAHLEEDAGKSLHEAFVGQTGIDLNRAGTPLLEIVSEPDMRSSAEAVAYLKKLHALVRYLEICDGNMQEGSFRCDANVSLRRPGDPFGTRAEIKNLNSFRFLEKAIEYEILRQKDILESGGSIVQETRLYDANRDETRSMRSKEEANDYRYFPDPDLLPLVLDEARIEKVRQSLPELPDAKRERFMQAYQLSAYDAGVLTAGRDLADYYESVADGVEGKLAANWVMGDLLGALNKAGVEIQDCPVSAEKLRLLVQRIEDKTISGKIAKEIFEEIFHQGGEIDAIIDSRGLRQITDASAIAAMVDEIIAANPQQVAGFRAGKDKLLGFFVGQVMKASQGKANPDQVNTLLLERLQKPE
ncbi:Asp-tRNA(Asn)/Glu-tRNA(Gln) amidotransferase subunit GatB [Acidithiobacillus thiooxidans]|jgi:aspartyl-tRNA(Asn)/glutamyl-tRNA(Gln) amidotransferase subunit B|uniref:Aspartyl/glutamyl-tRNA(Asn/Gln) amidotransferase subunit B n=2 Tax=Acidithiobacillaceae TaxID=225058 RepID=A0A1C2IFB7_ACITH|nr:MULTISPECIES: Asp-tRNA(Asn)/Glu-tRNA(Gln) amidotransferase subunit GatB [Acidithiobacillus]MBU2741288.1 Asp-tRNA(Asn)/Glu-tRNA(Gln) amidotransferase subunit GatB [Acidithiobacillus albertensis]MBU2749867.1 Asp-tRNA(Asn)/Glu-tRNA(Gln) amidotransferase subunit GatB [Acidithiobacillus thiooxidans]MBU2835391.1 Asp-tRNA(Asn)/Glu-tRNA(Gln) amidotransferase subunit GatB [Acidithiobacillus thiooxidans]MBU2841462.1 Asp-tRNA(Asn)/Glu-tRNA(Gln) amidotransferase subunit GatB [Acidithiobacillus thiooxida